MCAEQTRATGSLESAWLSALTWYWLIGLSLIQLSCSSYPQSSTSSAFSLYEWKQSYNCNLGPRNVGVQLEQSSERSRTHTLDSGSQPSQHCNPLILFLNAGMTPTTDWFSLLIQSSNLAAVMNCKVNIHFLMFFGDPCERVAWPSMGS